MAATRRVWVVLCGLEERFNKKCHVVNTDTNPSIFIPYPISTAFCNQIPILLKESMSHKIQGKMKPFPVPKVDTVSLSQAC